MKDKLALAGAVLGFLLAAMAVATLAAAIIIVIHAEARQEPLAGLLTFFLIPICFFDVLTLLRMYRGDPPDKEQRVPLRVAFWGTLGAVFAGFMQIAVHITTPFGIVLNVAFLAVAIAEAIVRILCIARL